MGGGHGRFFYKKGSRGKRGRGGHVPEGTLEAQKDRQTDRGLTPARCAALDQRLPGGQTAAVPSRGVAVGPWSVADVRCRAHSKCWISRHVPPPSFLDVPHSSPSHLPDSAAQLLRCPQADPGSSELPKAPPPVSTRGKAQGRSAQCGHLNLALGP